MAQTPTLIANRSIPAATVIPVLIYPDVRNAVDWLCAAFGFAERVRIAEDDPAGHQWTFSQTLADVALEEWGGISVGPAIPGASRGPARR
jgi:hypothetical protein